RPERVQRAPGGPFHLRIRRPGAAGQRRGGGPRRASAAAPQRAALRYAARPDVGGVYAAAGGAFLFRAGPGLAALPLRHGRAAVSGAQALVSRRMTSHSWATCSRSVARAPIETRTIQRPSRIAGVR